MAKRKTPFDRAVDFGRAARRDGSPISACPYDDKRKPSGKLSWSRAWVNAWCDGWNEENRKITERKDK